MARPSIQFYPGDYRRDERLRQCSAAARGVWMDMLCIMHQGTPYGYLRDEAGDVTVKSLSRLIGVSAGQLGACLQELESHAVFSRDEAGSIFSRRMVKDERIRLARAKGGEESFKNPAVPRKKDILPAILNGKHKDVLSVEDEEEERRKEVKLQEKKSALVPLLLSEYPQTIAVIREHDAAVDETFVRALANKVGHAIQSEPKFPQTQLVNATSDLAIAKACHESFATGPARHGTGLLLNRVPNIIVTWGLQGTED